MAARQTMTQAESSFEDVRRRQRAAEERHNRLTDSGHHWDHPVRNALHCLAHVRGPNGHGLGLLPVHRVRVRHLVGAEAWVWWIERDVPPYDLYRCEAYRVRLALDARGDPVLSVESGAGTKPVPALAAAALEAALAEAGRQPPLLIARAMGAAVD